MRSLSEVKFSKGDSSPSSMVSSNMGWYIPHGFCPGRNAMDLLRRQFQTHRGERIFTKLVGPEFKSYWPNRNKDLKNIKGSLFSSEIPLKYGDKLGHAFSKIVRQLPLTSTEIYRENMIEWRSRRGGNKKK